MYLTYMRASHTDIKLTVYEAKDNHYLVQDSLQLLLCSLFVPCS